MGWDLQTLFRLHAPTLVRSLRRRGASAETAEDLTQDAFLRLLGAAPPDQGPGGDARAYLLQTSRNLLIDHRRREGRAPLEAAEAEAMAEAPDPAPSVERRLDDRRRLARVEAALAGLPPKMRQAFELHRVEGLTLAETARRMGLSTTRVWALVRDAYRILRESLREP